jgi:hypothetical protein
MRQMIKSTGVKNALLAEAFPGIVALLIAGFFYKFGSFTWECVAFLATWYLTSFVFSGLRRLVVKKI